MANASISGLASGLDTAGIISQLMQLEAIPQSRLQIRVGTQEREVGAMQTLNAKLASLATRAKGLTEANAWTPLRATSSSDKVTVATTATASPTTLSVTVDKVALAHQIGYADKVALTDQVTGASTTVRLDRLDATTPLDLATDGTLKGLVDAINSPANATGLRASAVRVGENSYQLLVESTTTGESSDFKLSQLDGSALLGVPSERIGQNASISLGNGINATSSTNTFADLVPGVSLTLSPDTTAPTTTTITVARDAAGATTSIKGFVDALNAVIDEIDSLTAYNPATKASGLLAGNSVARDIRNTLLSAVLPSDGSTLANLGIQMDRSGNVVLDEAKFTRAYAADPAAVTTAFGAGGFAGRVSTIAEGASNKSDGALTTAIASRQSGIKRLTDSIAEWDVRLELRETTLSRQYTALEVVLNQMNSQSTWLAGQIAGLSSSSGS